MVRKSEKPKDDRAGSRRASLPARIKARLYLLIAMALVPMLLLFVWIYRQRYETQRRQALRTELEVAQGVATAFSVYIDGVRLQLEVIGELVVASSPGVTPDLAPSILAVTERYPSIRNLHWVGPDGLVLASSVPEAPGRDLSLDPSFGRVATGDSWTLGDLSPAGLFADVPTALLAVSIRDADGADHGHILASIEPNRLGELTLAPRRPEGGAHGVFDRAGVVAHRDLVGGFTWEERVRWRESDRVLSRVVETGHPYVGTGGLAHGEGQWVMARVPVLGLGWMVGAARPLKIVLAPIRSHLLQDAAIASAVFVFAFLMAYLIARTIADPLIALEADARAMGAGVIETRDDSAAPAEVRRLRETVTRIASDLVRRAETLRRSEHQYRSLFTNMTEGFALGEPVFNGDGPPVDFRFLECNAAFEEQAGLSPEILGKPMTEALPGLEAVWVERYCGVALTGESVRFREFNRHTGRHFEVFCYRPAELRFAIQFRNVTQEVRADEKLREAQRALEELNASLEERVLERTAALEDANREMEAFSYSVSHDLRAPLRSIDGFSKLLLEKHLDRLNPQGRNYLSRVRAAAQRMGRLIDDLLRLSRIGRAQMREERVNVSALAREVVQDLRSRDPDRSVSVEIKPRIVVTGDSALLRIVLENLIGNSWKFTGGRHEARIEVGAATIDGERVFHVRDNGAGFSMSYVDKLYAPFSRLHSEEEFAGTGIGLAIVHRIVVRHGGRIWAEGAEDAGATIYFTLGGTT